LEEEEGAVVRADWVDSDIPGVGDSIVEEGATVPRDVGDDKGNEVGSVVERGASEV
jgi:hypothetical protein